MRISIINSSFTITSITTIPAFIFSRNFRTELNELPILLIYFFDNGTTGSFANCSLNSFRINYYLSFLRLLLLFILNDKINITFNNLLGLLKVIMLFIMGSFLIFFLLFSFRLSISVFLVKTLLVATPDLPFTYFHMRRSSIRTARFLKTSTQNCSWPLLK